LQYFFDCLHLLFQTRFIKVVGHSPTSVGEYPTIVAHRLPLVGRVLTNVRRCALSVGKSPTLSGLSPIGKILTLLPALHKNSRVAEARTKETRKHERFLRAGFCIFDKLFSFCA